MENIQELENKISTLQNKIDSLEKLRADGWANVLAGLGGKMDKRKGTFFSADFDSVLLGKELDDMYQYDGLGTAVVDTVADDMTREWIHLSREDEEDMEDDDADIKTVMSVFNDLKAESIFNQALKWKRLFGGAIIIIGARDGQTLDMPLNVQKIKTIDNLLVLDSECIEITTSKFGTDPNNADYGMPIQFHVQYILQNTTQDFMVHASRCLVFYGKPLSKNSLARSDYKKQFWGMSEIQPVHNSLKDFGGIMGAVSNVLYEFSVDFFKIKGLAQALMAGNERAVIQRMDIIAMMKSVIHGVIMDADEEEWEKKTSSVTGLAELLYVYMSMVSATTRIPQTKLFGRSPAGMNATGESDMDMYYDRVKTSQKTDLKPQLTTLVDIIREWKGIKTPLCVEFNSLYQMSDKEEAELKKLNAETEKAKAETYKIYVEDMGVLTAEQVYEQEWSSIFGEMPEIESEPVPQPVQIVAPAGTVPAPAVTPPAAGTEPQPGEPGTEGK